jgi:large subunit ribosomal protein L1
MGKVRINTIGDESLEQKQKVKAEKRKETKKVEKETTEVNTVDVKSETVEKKAVIVKKSAEKASPRSKKYQSVVGIVDKMKTYELSEALELLPQIHLAKFDETVEVHINTHTTGVAGNVVLPHGTGKQVKVAILAPGKDEKGAEELMKEIAAGNINFDVLVATPDAMPKLAKYARVLGPRGLMPNPKNGTVTPKPEEVAKKFAGGQINFKTESKMPIIHMSVGKLSFKKEQLEENIKVAVAAVQNKNIKNITLKSTMSPGIKITVA